MSALMLHPIVGRLIYFTKAPATAYDNRVKQFILSNAAPHIGAREEVSLPT